MILSAGTSTSDTLSNAPIGAGEISGSEKSSPGIRIALAHDWLVGYRGGEAVLEAIARVLGRMPGVTIDAIYTMFDAAGKLGHDQTLIIDGLRKVSSSLNKLPGGNGRFRRWLLPMYPWAVDELSRNLAYEHTKRPIDLLISTSSAAIKGLRAPIGVQHICYCHSPARYLWSQEAEYASGSGGGLRALGLHVLGKRLRAWDKQSATHVDVFLANSSAIRRAISDAFGRDSMVVFPPVRTDYFTPDPATPRSADWLYVGALEPYKRVDLLIRAATTARHRLIIIGTGSQDGSLRTLAHALDPAGKLVVFRGRIDDAGVRHAYRSAGVLLMPQIEDFGIVAVEAQACGLPVATFNAGGALDWLVPDKTGITFDHATPDGVFQAASKALTLTNASNACQRNSERFSVAVFEHAFERVVREALPRLRD